MSTQPTVVVNKKGGFFTAVAQGLFGFLIVSVICATILGLYWGWMIDGKFTRAMDLTGTLAANGGWRELLPPVVSDALDDRRAPEYADKLAISAEAVPGLYGDGVEAVLRVSNDGEEVVSVLTGRIVLIDDDGAPVAEGVVWVATPLTVPDDRCNDRHQIRGPILPGNERLLRVRGLSVPDSTDVRAVFEPTEIRVWAGPPTEKNAAPGPETALPQDRGH